MYLDLFWSVLQKPWFLLHHLQDLVQLGDGTDQTRTLSFCLTNRSWMIFCRLTHFCHALREGVTSWWQTQLLFEGVPLALKMSCCRKELHQLQSYSEYRAIFAEEVQGQCSIVLQQSWDQSCPFPCQNYFWEDLGYETCNEKFSDQTDVVAFLPVTWPCYKGDSDLCFAVSVTFFLFFSFCILWCQQFTCIGHWTRTNSPSLSLSFCLSFSYICIFRCVWCICICHMHTNIHGILAIVRCVCTRICVAWRPWRRADSFRTFALLLWNRGHGERHCHSGRSLWFQTLRGTGNWVENWVERVESGRRFARSWISLWQFWSPMLRNSLYLNASWYHWLIIWLILIIHIIVLCCTAPSISVAGIGSWCSRQW